MSENESKPEKITPEQIIKLLDKAKDTEWRYLLKIREWARQGSAYTDYAESQVIYGEAERVTLERWDAGYPYATGEDVLIIPKTVPVIVIWEHVTDQSIRRIVYVFTSDGWKEVVV